MLDNTQAKDEQLSQIWDAMVSTYAKKDDLMHKLEVTSTVDKYDLMNEVDRLHVQFYNLENQYYELKYNV